MATVVVPPSNPDPAVHGPDPITLEGRAGWRYWVHRPCELTCNREVDERYSGYPVAVFTPVDRDPAATPVVIGLQGMAAPYTWNGFLVPTLLDMGIACVLFDTPGAGERSLSRTHDGDVVTELTAMADRGVRLSAASILRLFGTVAHDYGAVLDLIEGRHGLTDSRRALFGVSLGALLSSYAFLRYHVGARLLCAIGHADLARFAWSYLPRLGGVLGVLPAGLLRRPLSWVAGPRAAAALNFLGVLRQLAGGRGAAREANPMTYLDRGDRRPARFLVGGADPRVNPDDAQECASRFADGECYVVPGLDHGGGDFIDHVRYFLVTQLGDWRP